MINSIQHAGIGQVGEPTEVSANGIPGGPAVLITQLISVCKLTGNVCYRVVCP